MAAVSKEQAGTYRQLSHRIRIDHGPGKGETLSERPRAGSGRNLGRYLDDANPTMLTLKVGDLVDVDFLLGIGAIEPKAEPAAAAQPARPDPKEVKASG